MSRQNKTNASLPIDINQIMQSAQEIAKTINLNDKDNKLNKMNMDQMFDHVTNTVFSGFEKSGKPIDPASKQQMKLMSKVMMDQVMETMAPEINENIDSKIDLGDTEEDTTTHNEMNTEDSPNSDKIPQKENIFEDLDSDSETEQLAPVVDDLKYNLPVTMAELYTGKKKKLAITVNRIEGKKIKPVKRKIEIPILPGMKNGQEIRFNRQGNEKFGFQSGDIVIRLAVNSDNHFERVGNMLCYVKNISLYESYAAGRGDINVVIQHLDSSYLVLKTDGNPLHTKDGARKIRNGGMPSFNKKTGKMEFADLYIRFNVILPQTFEGDEELAIIEKLFPVLPDNEKSVVYRNKSHPGFQPGTSKVREVLLEEVTPEDHEQIDYEEEQDEESSYDSESHSDSEKSNSE